MAVTSFNDCNVFTSIWKIENFSLCSRKTGQFITSPIFTVETFMDTKWYLKLYPKGFETYEYAALYLCRCEDDLLDDKLEIEFSFQAIDGNGDFMVNDQNASKHVFKKGSTAGKGVFLIETLTKELLIWKDDTLTVICTMSYKRKPSKCFVCTKVNVEHNSFILKVPFLDPCTSVHEFSFSKNSRYLLKVGLENNDLKIEVHQQSESFLVPRCLLARINLVNIKGRKFPIEKAIHEFESSKVNQLWKFPCSIKKKLLQGGDFLKNNYFTMFCEFSASTKTESSIQKQDSPHHKSLLVLHEDLRCMFADKKYCDVNLRVGNETIPAHKSLLAARSPIFATMFNQDMDENNTVHVSDLCAKTIICFLEFIYSGKTEIKDLRGALKLLKAADKYKVHSLKEVCCTYVLREMSVNNACEILHIADLISHESLKQSVLEFITANITEVCNSSDWPKWIVSNSLLLNEIMQHVAGNFDITPKKRLITIE